MPLGFQKLSIVQYYYKHSQHLSYSMRFCSSGVLVIILLQEINANHIALLSTFCGKIVTKCFRRTRCVRASSCATLVKVKHSV